MIKFDNTGWNLKNSYLKLPELFFTLQKPVPVKSPKLIILNESLAESLGFSVEYIKTYGDLLFSGNLIPEDAKPLAQAYAGHQFGHFTILGDGRAVLLGEQISPSNSRFDIQLKGSGETPYSRRGDGRASLASMLREYIISEAMYGLGIPTTRSLAVVTTGETIQRVKVESGAILTRVAASHIRVGTFEYARNFGTIEDVKTLANYTLKRHFPDYKGSDNNYLYLLQEVIKRQAELIAKWQLVGFIHGVMNTDNMTISGETIDYGPCAFMDTYDPSTVFSSIDTEGRYAFGNQPNIAVWNLTRFAETILNLLDENEDKAIKLAEKELMKFFEIYQTNWIKGMRSKLGLLSEEESDEVLIEELLNIMKKYRADYTNTFIALTFDKVDDSEFFNSVEFKDWYYKWQERLSRENADKNQIIELMKNSNPAIIPRNHRVEEALIAASKNNDLSVLHKFLDALSNPYAHSLDQVEYSKLPKPSECVYETYCGT